MNRAAGIFHLLPGSPCIDAAEVYPFGTDLFGNYRQLDGDGDGIAETDMGAYEYDRNDDRALDVGPELVEFVSRHGGAPPDGKPILIRSATGAAFDWTVEPSVPWLRASRPSGEAGSATEAIDLYAVPDELAPGVYLGRADFRIPTANRVVGSVEVVLRVTEEFRVPETFSSIQQAINAASASPL